MHEIRCYPAGVSSYIKEITDPNIVTPIYNDVQKLIAGTHFKGFMDIDLKCDLNTGVYYILDFNPRSPASLSAWVRKYRSEDLVKMFKNINSPSILKPAKEGIIWCNLLRDYRSRSKSKSKSSWISSLQAYQDVWCWFDPLPFIVQPVWVLIRKLQKNGN